MNAKLEKTLKALGLIAGCVFLCVLYVVYVPLAIIRVLVDKESFSDFVECLGECVRKLFGWFRKSAK